MENRAGLSTLLDGHHKATACYLEGKAISCITIANVHFYSHSGRDGIFYLGECVPCIKIKSEKSIKRIFNKRNKKEKIINTNITLENSYTNPIDIVDIKNNFPLYEEYALSTLAEDVSEEKINELLSYKGGNPVESIKEIFYNLRINNKERAKRLCFLIINLEEFQEIWFEVVEFLCKYKDNEVQDIFVEILIKYDSYVGYDNMKFIIDKYFINLK